VTLDAFGSEYDSQRQLQAFQNGPLLDVELDQRFVTGEGR